MDFARNFTPDLTLFVCTLSHESIPGILRFRWMQEMFPQVRIVHITEEIPQASRTNTGAQEIWAASILRHLEEPPDYVFASEEYGVELARSLGAMFVPVDPRRSVFPISAGMIRSQPYAHWDFIPPVVRPYFVRRVSIDAADDGLVKRLAERFDTVYVSDYGRYRASLGYAEPAPSPDMTRILAQAASEQAMLGRANRVLFLERDILGALLEEIGSERSIEDVDGDLRDLLSDGRPDLVLRVMGGNTRHRREATRLGWDEKVLESGGVKLETEAVDAVQQLLDAGADRGHET